MAYDLLSISEEVEACLLSSPRSSLAKLAQQLKVERHTIERAVRVGRGKCFRELQIEMLSRKGFELLTVEPTLSIKEIAVLLGFKSGQAFCHFMKRTHGKTPKKLRIDKKQLKPATTVT